MPPYRAYFSAASQLAPAEPFRLQVESETGVVHVLLESANAPSPLGAPVHLGLWFTVALDETSLDRAVARAAFIVGQLSDLLAATHAVEIADAQPELVVDLDPSVSEREMAQWVRDLPLRTPRRQFHPEKLQAFYAGPDVAAKLAPGPEEREDFPRRLDRALRYLRRSHGEADPADRFEDLWNGLVVSTGECNRFQAFTGRGREQEIQAVVAERR